MKTFIWGILSLISSPRDVSIFMVFSLTPGLNFISSSVLVAASNVGLMERIGMVVMMVRMRVSVIISAFFHFQRGLKAQQFEQIRRNMVQTKQ